MLVALAAVAKRLPGAVVLGSLLMVLELQDRARALWDESWFVLPLIGRKDISNINLLRNKLLTCSNPEVLAITDVFQPLLMFQGPES